MPSTSTDRDYLRPTEVADLLHVSVKTVNRWAREGMLPHLKTLGGHRRYSKAEVLAVLERQTVAVTDEDARRQYR